MRATFKRLKDVKKGEVIFKKSCKPLIVLIALITAHYYLDIFVESQTHKFTLCGISSKLEFHPEWETPPPSSEERQGLQMIFQQKFTFLNSGGQSFAFLSEDGKYVLKFFKLYRRRLPDGLMYLPLPSFLERLREKSISTKQGKLKRDFASYILAYQELREESGLIFLHLNKTNFLKQTVTLVDALGIAHEVSLDEKEFLLQTRVTLAYDAINHLMAEQAIESAKKRIDGILELTLLRYQKGIYDDDAFISKNYGFDGEKPILLDIGRFQKKPEYSQPEVYIKDLELITNRFKNWLEKSHPELVSYLDEKRGQICYPN